MTRMRTGRSRGHSEGGAILIQVAIGLLVLTGFAMFAVDYGLMWVGRRQAQNAADAGALAGAVAMAFDGADRTNTGPAKTSAYKTAVANVVLGQSPGLNNPATEAEGSSTDVQFYPDNPSRFPSICADNSCVRVDVYRNQETGHTNNSVLPVWFGGLVGVQSQGTKAMAVARSAPANGTQCLKPWAVADKWLEGPVLDTDADGFQWTQSNNYNPLDGDSYVPPSATDLGTGFSNKDASGAPRDWGYQLTLKLFNPSNGGGNGGGGTFVMSSGWAMALDLPNTATPQYQENISTCTSASVGISPPDNSCTYTNATTNYVGGCLPVLTGSRTGMDKKGIDDLIALDPNAKWDKTLNSGKGGINTTKSPSPRIVPVAVFNTDAYYQGVVKGVYNGSNGFVKVVNILGFFVEGFCSDLNASQRETYLVCTNSGQESDIVGRLVSYPAINIPGATNIGNAAFGQVITLIR